MLIIQLGAIFTDMDTLLLLHSLSHMYVCSFDFGITLNLILTVVVYVMCTLLECVERMCYISDVILVAKKTSA